MLGEWLIAWAFAWVIMKGFGALWGEYAHARDSYATDLSREHRDWSPRRVHRNARRRARAKWWTEIREGFPTLRDEMAKDWLIAETELEEARAAGRRTRRELTERLEKARAARKAAQEPPAAPEPPPEGAPAKPVLTPISGGRAPTRTGTPAKETPPPPVPATPEPPSPEPTGTGGTTGTPKDALKPEPRVPASSAAGAEAAAARWDDPLPSGNGDPVTAPIWAIRRDKLLAAGRCVRETGTGRDGPVYCGKPAPPREAYCPEHVRPPVTAISGPGWAATKGISREEADNFVRTGHTDGTYPVPGSPGYQSGDNPVAEINGGHMTAASSPADIESGDSPYEGMLNTASRIAGTARTFAATTGDDLRASATVHKFSRDAATMADIAAVEDAAAALSAAAERLHSGMIARHADGDEYHSGQDANASAFRPA